MVTKIMTTMATTLVSLSVNLAFASKVFAPMIVSMTVRTAIEILNAQARPVLSPCLILLTARRYVALATRFTFAITTRVNLTARELYQVVAVAQLQMDLASESVKAVFVSMACVGMIDLPMASRAMPTTIVLLEHVALTPSYSGPERRSAVLVERLFGSMTNLTTRITALAWYLLMEAASVARTSAMTTGIALKVEELFAKLESALMAVVPALAYLTCHLVPTTTPATVMRVV